MKSILSRLTALSGIYVAASFLAATPAAAQLNPADFAGCSAKGCQYRIIWDGHQGTLQLFPNAGGQLITANGRHKLTLTSTVDPQSKVTGGHTGPGYRTNSNLRHRIVFWVDFNNTPNNRNDDQMFDGYMMTQTKNAIAGITWWRNIPFGFYADNKQPIR
ncbi:MAG: hypothetical protein OEZ03_14795 [Alphaproteobacteria bacterium]|nr:hypothetical protein [Alphaproteobacteria bacterium]